MSINADIQWLYPVATMAKDTEDDQTISPGCVDCLQRDVTFVNVHHWIAGLSLETFNYLMKCFSPFSDRNVEVPWIVLTPRFVHVPNAMRFKLEIRTDDTFILVEEMSTL